MTGKIVSCSGCSLNRLRELKAFLKDNLEAQEYEGIEVEFVHGKQPILTIYRDGMEEEQVVLSNYETREDLHALMQSKGFVKKSPEEIAEFKRIARQEEERRLDKQRNQERKWRRLQEDADEETGEDKAALWYAMQEAKIAQMQAAEEQKQQQQEQKEQAGL